MVLVALAYSDNDDINRASSRLALLKEDNPASALAALAQQKLAHGGSPDQARALADLSAALGGDSPAVQEKTVQDEASPTPEMGNKQRQIQPAKSHLFPETSLYVSPPGKISNQQRNSRT